MVFDDDHYYMGGVVAELLRRGGYAVTLVTPGFAVSAWTVDAMERTVQTRLIELGVTLACSRTVLAGASGGVVTACAFPGRESEMACDGAVFVTGRLPEDSLAADWQPDRTIGMAPGSGPFAPLAMHTVRARSRPPSGRADATPRNSRPRPRTATKPRSTRSDGPGAGQTVEGRDGNRKRDDSRLAHHRRCSPVGGGDLPANARVSADDVAAFGRDGVVAFHDAFTEWVEPLHAGLQRTLDEPDRYAFPCESSPVDEPGRLFDSYCNWQLIPEYLAFVLTSRAASLAGQVMGSRSAQLFHEHAFCKEAGTTKATPWHHDLPYYCVDGRQTASVYVALDTIPSPSRSGSGGVPTTATSSTCHRDFAAGAEYDAGDSTMLSVPDVDTEARPGDILALDLEPGDAYVFDFRTLHGSGNAAVTARRRAFSTRWLGDDVTYVDRPGETSPPLSDLGMRTRDRMREDWFPVLWTAPT